MCSGVSVSSIPDGFQISLGGLPIPLLWWRWLLSNFSQRVRDVDKRQYPIFLSCQQLSGLFPYGQVVYHPPHNSDPKI